MTSEFIRCPECDGYNCDDACTYPDTRATPSADPLAGLVRYWLSVRDRGTYYDAEMLVDNQNGEYVLHSEAAKIIAAKDAEIAVGDAAIKQNALLWKRAEAAEAELAQIKAQEPVMWLCVHDDRGSDRAITTPFPSRRDILKADGYEITPLYASLLAPDGGKQ